MLPAQHELNTDHGHLKSPAGLSLPIIPGFILLVLIIAAIATRLLLVSLPLNMDEYDYLFVSRMFAAGDSWPTLTYIFGADFNWHLMGWAEAMANGPAGARIAAGILGLLSMLALYRLVCVVWNSRLQGLLAVIFLAGSAPHVYISSLVTYDVIALCLFAWAMVPLWRLLSAGRKGDDSEHSERPLSRTKEVLLFLLASSLLIGAVLSKYVLVLYLPVLLLLVLVKRARYAIPAVVLIGGVLGGYAWVFRDSLRVLYETQILLTQTANISRPALLDTFWHMIGWSLLLLIVLYMVYQSIRSSAALRKMQEIDTLKEIQLPIAFVILALPLPLYHLYASNQIAAVKHLVYSTFFLAPVIALSIVRILDESRKIIDNQIREPSKTQLFGMFGGLAVAMVLVFQVAVKNFIVVSELSNGLPDLSEPMDYWNENRHLSQDSGRLLSEDPYLFRYAALPGFPQAFIKETTFLDNDLDGSFTSRDVRDAIWDRKFGWVLLTDQIHPKDNLLYRRLLQLRDYQRVVVLPYSLSSYLTGNRRGIVELYQLQLPAAALPD